MYLVEEHQNLIHFKVCVNSKYPLELAAAPRLRSPVPDDVSILIEKENVQFDVVAHKGKFQTVLHLQNKIRA